MNKLGNRIRVLRKQKGMTQARLAERLSFTREALAKWETGKSDPDTQTITRLASFFNVTTDFLLGRTEAPRGPGAAYREQPTGLMVKLPVLGTIRAGAPLLADEQVIDWEDVPADTVRGADYFILQVEGDSMTEAHMPAGSRVLVRRQDVAENGDIVIAFVGDEDATVKKFYQLGEAVLLCPASPLYEPTEHHARDVRVIGKVVMSMVKH